MPDDNRVILYIDDDPDYRLAARQLLEANGYTFIEAESGEEGLRAFREHHPALVIVDLMMEEIDAGVSFLREVRSGGSTAPVYLMSSVGDSLAMTTNAAEMGFSGVFQKPFSNERLLTVIRSQLR